MCFLLSDKAHEGLEFDPFDVHAIVEDRKHIHVGGRPFLRRDLLKFLRQSLDGVQGCPCWVRQETIRTNKWRALSVKGSSSQKDWTSIRHEEAKQEWKTRAPHLPMWHHQPRHGRLRKAISETSKEVCCRATTLVKGSMLPIDHVYTSQNCNIALIKLNQQAAVAAQPGAELL